jgi:acyl dehydratase
MFTMARAGRAVADWAGGTDRIVEYGVRFARPVVVPDDDTGVEIEVTGELGEAAVNGTATITLTCTCNGEQVLTKATAVVRR